MKKWMALPSLFLSLAVWQASAEERRNDAAAKTTIPDSGMGATTVGQRIVLLRDPKNGLQTWKSDIFKSSEDSVMAIADNGATVALTIQNSDSNNPTFTWSYVNSSAGQIQILITRALKTPDAIDKRKTNCIPVVTVRNLTTHGMYRVVAEMEYLANNKVVSSGSSMFGPLDQGETQALTTDALYDANCGRISARMHIPFCKFSNGLDCKNRVVGSKFGAIPVKLGRSSLPGKAQR